MDQRDLVERAQQGDQDAFAVLAGAAVGDVLILDASTGEMNKVGWRANFAQGPSWQRTVTKD